MDSITLKNFRCFREEQTARLAPLTFLVGENSTGKSSLMALIRALWDVAFRDEVPDFREEPYNLGSFNEIVHSRGGRGGRANSFEAGFQQRTHGSKSLLEFHATFEERSADPFPTVRRFRADETSVEVSDLGGGLQTVKLSHHEEFASKAKDYLEIKASLLPWDDNRLAPLYNLEFEFRRNLEDANSAELPVEAGILGQSNVSGVQRRREQPATTELYNRFRNVVRGFSILPLRSGLVRPFAGAPVRSRPLRTYDPGRASADPEGGYIPTYLASLYHRNPDGWQKLKGNLEDFGRASGLFDEISIKPLGKTEGTPFQVQIRKFSTQGHKGPQRNLIDVGYGVSQALPLLSELLRHDSPTMLLLQQPEVHLHPKAQAALGSLFCNVAGARRQLIVETHSDHLLDRVRMDIRDKRTALTHNDVSILYFEPGDLDVRIYSIQFDEYGNVTNEPSSYRRFFMEEISRSIGIGP